MPQAKLRCDQPAPLDAAVDECPLAHERSAYAYSDMPSWSLSFLSNRSSA